MIFEKKKFIDFIKLQRGYDLTKDEIVDGVYPIVSSTSIIGFHNEYKMEGPGVVTGRSGTIGQVQYVEGRYWPHNTTLFVKDFKGNYPKFVYYFMKNFGLEGVKGGSAVPTLNRNSLSNIEVNIPNLNLQKRIAGILSSYDNLIKNNEKQIKLLEEAAQRLYKEWFVDLRFPGYEGVQIVDGVPKGWTRSILNTYCEIKSGYAFKSKNWSNFGLGVVKIKDISDCFINYFDCAKVSESTAQKAINYQLNKGDLVIAMTGATIGKIGISTKDNYYANQRVGKVFLGNSPIDKLPFAFCVLSQDSSFQYIVKHSSSSSAQPNISGEKIGNIPILYNESYVSRFNSMLAPAFKKIINLKEEIELCKESRDRLLPKLMNGEIEI